MCVKVKKFGHFNKERRLPSATGRISKNKGVCPLQIRSRSPGIYFRPSSVFFLTRMYYFNTLLHVPSRKF